MKKKKKIAVAAFTLNLLSEKSIVYGEVPENKIMKSLQDRALTLFLLFIAGSSAAGFFTDIDLKGELT